MPPRRPPRLRPSRTPIVPAPAVPPSALTLPASPAPSSLPPLPPLLALFGTWQPLHARINDEATPERVARRLYDRHRRMQAAIACLPATTLPELAAKVLALSEHGTMELPEALAEECAAIVAEAMGTASRAT